MSRQQWILCPICGNKTRIMIREDKLVRDRIPEIIAAQGEKPIFRVMDDLEYTS